MTAEAARPRIAVRRLQLTGFRNYPHLDLSLDGRSVVLTGENGAGKTNLLEAVSLLSPGRGMRRAAYDDMASGVGGFFIHARLSGPAGETEIGTSAGEPGEPARKVRIDGTNARSADELLDVLRVMWLTPAMDGLFAGPAAERRRFADRLVLTVDPGHGKRALDYEKAMRGRNRLLAEESRDGRWFDAIEHEMAETGVAIAAARVQAMGLIRQMTERQPEEGPFPRAGIVLSGHLEERVADVPALDLEDEFRRSLREARSRDRAAGRTLEGPHRSDLLVRHAPKDMPAELCSTGEQKALLIGIILAHARLTGDISGMTPILLLDEIAAHLDPARRAALFSILEDLNCQAFMTGTDASLFEAMGERAQHLIVASGEIHAA